MSNPYTKEPTEAVIDADGMVRFRAPETIREVSLSASQTVDNFVLWCDNMHKEIEEALSGWRKPWT